MKTARTELSDSISLMSAIRVNSLEEKNVYIYYYRATINGQNDPCGRDFFKLKKEGVFWKKIEEVECPNGIGLWELTW